MHLRLVSLSVFRGLRQDPVIAALETLLAGGDEPLAKRLDAYAGFASRLLSAGGDWTGYLYSRMLLHENEYVRRLAAGQAIPRALTQALEADIASLQALSGLCPADLLPEGAPDFPIAKWETGEMDFRGGYHQYMRGIRETGYGIFAEHHMFLLQNGELEPVLCPDPVDFDKLTGYERERQAVWDNTLALAEGRQASNVLLYGDSGTGKSTCVKAVANALRHRGLRLVELHKDQLCEIPRLVSRLSGNPLSFILFIDDLSFSTGNDSFSALKAVLEGSVCARSSNILIYATSNRRHLVRENFADRQGGDIHLRDTLEEVSSLSERFGLTITFLRPDREVYLSIAKSYCTALGLAFNEETARAAEAFALERGGRNARTARQFAENLAVLTQKEGSN